MQHPLLVQLVGEQIEPQKKEGETGPFIYYSDRPTETFVVYIINRFVLESLAMRYQKPVEGLHIHRNVNTEGHVICWPQKIDSIEAAKKVLSDWAGIIGALLVSGKDDINKFYHQYGGDTRWMQMAMNDNGVTVKLTRS